MAQGVDEGAGVVGHPCSTLTARVALMMTLATEVGGMATLGACGVAATVEVGTAKTTEDPLAMTTTIAIAMRGTIANDSVLTGAITLTDSQVAQNSCETRHLETG